MTTLNERQLALYKYMNDHTGIINRFVLMVDMEKWYHRQHETSNIQNSSAYRLLRRDIVAINKSNAQYTIVPVKVKGKLLGYKLADAKEEVQKEIDRLRSTAFKKMLRAAILAKKLRNDGQIRIAGESELKTVDAVVRKSDG